MPHFVIDEDISKSTSLILSSNGYQVFDIRESGLRGARDEEVFRFAQEKQAVLLTGDWGFGNIIQFPLGSHYGIVIIHYPNEVSSLELNKQIIRELKSFEEIDFKGNLIILEPGKTRIRRV